MFQYNSPVILTFALISTVIMSLDRFLGMSLTSSYFTLNQTFVATEWDSYVRLFSHVIGHANFTHLTNNMIMMLLVGPILEEKYGHGSMILMILSTGFVTSLLNTFFFTSGLLGASGVVFMLIILASFANRETGKIPLTFVLIFVIFVGKEIIAAYGQDNISQFAHIIGGGCGALFGFLIAGKKARTTRTL